MAIYFEQSNEEMMLNIIKGIQTGVLYINLKCEVPFIEKQALAPVQGVISDKYWSENAVFGLSELREKIFAPKCRERLCKCFKDMCKNYQEDIYIPCDDEVTLCRLVDQLIYTNGPNADLYSQILDTTSITALHASYNMHSPDTRPFYEAMEDIIEYADDTGFRFCLSQNCCNFWNEHFGITTLEPCNGECTNGFCQEAWQDMFEYHPINLYQN